MFRRVPTYELSDEAEKTLQSIGAKTSVDTGALLSEAISILDLVVTAKLAGKKILIADQDEVPLQEIDLELPLKTPGG